MCRRRCLPVVARTDVSGLLFSLLDHMFGYGFAVDSDSAPRMIGTGTPALVSELPEVLLEGAEAFETFETLGLLMRLLLFGRMLADAMARRRGPGIEHGRRLRMRGRGRRPGVAVSVAVAPFHRHRRRADVGQIPMARLVLVVAARPNAPLVIGNSWRRAFEIRKTRPFLCLMSAPGARVLQRGSLRVQRSRGTTESRLVIRVRGRHLGVARRRASVRARGDDDGTGIDLQPPDPLRQLLVRRHIGAADRVVSRDGQTLVGEVRKPAPASPQIVRGRTERSAGRRPVPRLHLRIGTGREQRLSEVQNLGPGRGLGGIHRLRHGECGNLHARPASELLRTFFGRGEVHRHGEDGVTMLALDVRQSARQRQRRVSALAFGRKRIRHLSRGLIRCLRREL